MVTCTPYRNTNARYHTFQHSDWIRERDETWSGLRPESIVSLSYSYTVSLYFVGRGELLCYEKE
jgi:hypothetical protein